MTGVLAAPCVQAQSSYRYYNSPYYRVGQHYISDLGMTLEQICKQGGPMYNVMSNRLRTINFNQSLRNQTIPVISVQEIKAFERERMRIRQLSESYRNDASMISHPDFYELRSAYRSWSSLLMSRSNAYSSLYLYIQRVSHERPDAIQ